jgi:hypothetical protein
VIRVSGLAGETGGAATLRKFSIIKRKLEKASTRIIKLRKPTKLGVSAPWVRFDRRSCECVA